MKFFVLLLPLVALTNAGDDYDKSLLFKYTADFRTGIYEPDSHGSQFNLRGYLHGQYDKVQKNAIFYFSNVSIAMYTGELPMVGELKNEHYFFPITTEVDAFENPFMVNESSLYDKIFTDGAEPKWMVDIKKSVASLLQFNWESFSEHVNSNVPVTFQSKESTIYGQCLVSYTVEPENKKWVVTKQFDPKYCSNFSHNTYNNVDLTECQKMHYDDDLYLANNRRVYTIVGEKGDHVFKKIESFGELFISPMRSVGERKYANVKQTIEFVKYEDKKEIIFNEKIPHNIVFSSDDMTEEEILDITYAYSQNYDDNLKQTNVEICIYGVEKLSRNFSNVDYYNYVVKKFSYFTVDDFETCAQTLPDAAHNPSKYMLDTFYKLIPLIGTKASIIYIKNVVKSGEISNLTSIAMLQYFPFEVILPTEQLLIDISEFIDPNFVSNPIIRHTAILAYSNLIYKTFKSNPDSSVLKKYIKTYYTFLKTATTYAEQFIWLQGLKNIQVGHVWQLLIPLIKGEQVLALEYDHYLREHAIHSAFGSVRDHAKEFYNVLWPIITNRNLNTELRVTAIKIYIHGGITNENIVQIFMYMQSETNPQVYNFFRTLVNIMGETTCETVVSKYIDQFGKYLKNYGSHINTYTLSNEFSEGPFRVGGRIYGYQIANQKNQPQTTFFKMDVYNSQKVANIYSFFFKYHGAASLWNMLTTYPVDKHDPIHYEYLFSVNNKIVFAQFFNNENINELDPKHFIMFQGKNEFLNIRNIVKFDKIIPTDLGLPLVLHFKMSAIANIDYATEEGKHEISLGYAHALSANSGITVYNPFSNVWHGVMRRVQTNVAFNFMIDVGKKQISMFQGNQEENFLTYNNHLDSNIFLKHASNSSFVEDVCKNCEYHDNSYHYDSYNRISEFDHMLIDFSNFQSTTEDENIIYNAKPTFTIMNKKNETKFETSFTVDFSKYYELQELNVEISKIVENKPNLNICFDYSKIFSSGEYIGLFNYFEGYSSQKECVRDAFKASIMSTSEKSDEQLKLRDATYTYPSCEARNKFLDIVTPVSMECIKAHTSLLHTSYVVEYKNLPEHHRTIFSNLWEYIKNDHVYDVEETERTTSSKTFKVDITQSVKAGYFDSTVDVDVTFPRYVYSFSTDDYPKFSMDNSHFSYQFTPIQYEVYACVVRTSDKVLVGQFMTEEKITPEYKNWTKMMSINDDFIVEVRQDNTLDTTMSLRITFNNNTLYVHYDTEEGEYEYTMDNHMINSVMNPYSDEVSPYGVERLFIDNTLVFLFKKYEIHVIYTGQYVKIETENYFLTTEKIQGKCVKKKINTLR